MEPMKASEPGMQLQRLTLDPRLEPYVARAWHFESPGGMPSADLKTVVPNGFMKLIIPYRGALECLRRGQLVRAFPTASIGLVGLQEEPVVIDGAGPLATIGVELHPSAAYRFFPTRLADLANGVYLAQDVVDRFDPWLSERLASAPTLSRRVAIVEDLLLRLLQLGRGPSALVDWAVGEIRLRHGAVRVDELCKRLGYSRRHVDQRFAEQVGVSPKILAAIFRFQRVFTELKGASPPPSALELYFDQPHFIREFKRFAGRAPGAYARERNEFGELFYRR